MAKTKCTPEMIANIARYIENGCNDIDTCNLVGIDRTTFYNWINKGEKGEEPYSTFTTEIAQARPKFKLYHEQNINKLAANSENDNVKLNASQFMLERRFPDEYGRRERREITGAEGQPIAIAVFPKSVNTVDEWIETTKDRKQLVEPDEDGIITLSEEDIVEIKD